MDYDKIIKFLGLSRGKKFNILLSVFSSLISGFILLFFVRPDYCKDIGTFFVVMLSFSIIAPIYILSQIGSVIVAYKLSQRSLTKAASFTDLLSDNDKALDNFISEFLNSAFSHFIYNPPVRQVGELITVISVYLAALISYTFNFSLAPMYAIVIFISCMLLFATFKFFNAVVNKLEPSHFEKIANKLRKDEDFKAHLKKRLDHIESLIKEKNA